MRSEFGQIEKLRNHFNLTKIGDDCAVLPKDAQKDLLITADLLVEDIDFRLSWAKPYDVGYKSLGVSLSDIAAMGGTPKFAMLSIGIPKSLWNTDFVDEFYRGWFALAKRFDIELIGGDTSKTPDKVIIDSILLGEVEKDKAIMRSGANPGDLIFVSGELGAAAAGLQILEANKNANHSHEEWESRLTQKQLQPEPEVKIGKTLYSQSLATSMIDISDGLSGDLFHICNESIVGAKIYTGKLPIDENLKHFNKSSEEKLAMALHGGEDFKLLFTVDPKKKSHKILDDFHLIGEITEGPANIELITDSKSAVLPPESFSHF